MHCMGRRNTPREEPQRAAIPLRPESMPAAGENGSESELPASAPRPPVWRRPIGWLIALAVMLRLVSAPYLISEENPLFDPETFPNGDLIDNMQQARQVLERGGTPEGYFKHGPLYVYLLAGVMKATGGRFWWMYGLQLCAGVAGVALMYLAARRLIGEPGATAAGALAALYAPAVYYETVMTADALNPVVVALILYLGARYQTHPQASAWRIPVLLGLALGGLTMLRANLCLIESMFALDEACLAIRAARENTRLEVICTFTFAPSAQGGYRSMMGVSPAEMVREALAAGAQAVGTNCGQGFALMEGIVREMRPAAGDAPIVVHANAGLPHRDGERDIFPDTPETVAREVPLLRAAGARVIGGCCGTTPAHIAAIAGVLKSGTRKGIDG
ncbi:MAG: Bifunctional homocysteine S-methyltransferase/5,10-methylenetetrahydrofolate reductase [candidate division BRC1 bacterium ADurb.BinA292]|nr:MAG: Bifunctional homocysteine S-methyltransferase/5,10-methylenetetrahydrofolate reductase [candidate division BRC1 bacterium ADurb.BinA292]